MNKIYTGIGSRKAPADAQILLAQICRELAENGFTLRSGGADGCDKACEAGCDEGRGQKEIYLPWRLFNNNSSDLHHICEGAMEMAKHYHPIFNRLSQSAKLLMARNCYQVLGLSLKTPSQFVVCWTPNGEDVGGTAQALRIAYDYKIPVFNIAFSDADILEKLRKKAIG